MDNQRGRHRKVRYVKGDISNPHVSRLKLPLCSSIMKRNSDGSLVKKNISALSDIFNIEGVIGQGSFGIVYRGRLRGDPSGAPVAVKVLKLEDSGDEKAARGEVRNLLQLQGSCRVLRFHFATYVSVPGSKNNFVLCTECLECDLRQCMKPPGIEKRTVAGMASDILEGLVALKDKKIVHRDIAPANLLYDGRGLKIADFGCAACIGDSGVPWCSTQYVVTMWYRAPEIILGSPRYDFSVDLWGAGCVIAEMCKNPHVPMFQGDSEIGTLFKIFRACGTPTEESWPGFETLEHSSTEFPKWEPQLREAISGKVPRAAEDLLHTILIPCPARRASIEDAASRCRQWKSAGESLMEDINATLKEQGFQFLFF